MNIDPIALAKELIACESVTPHVGKAFDLLQTYLDEMGFATQRVVFDEDNHPTENLYARLGVAAPNLCFAGHLDVVPPGDWSRWTYPPFEPTEADGKLYGRGAEDMKSAIAAFVAAVSCYLNEKVGQQADPALSSSHREGQETVAGDKHINGSISFLITGDEEGIAINGTKKTLQWLAEKGEKIDACIVGEPTNPHKMGEMIKVGRRGSINGTITAIGKQGHVAYPHLADNPITKLVALLNEMQNELLDEGTEFFPPTNLEITSLDAVNATTNLIPASAQARFNIRFNDTHSGASLQQWAHDLCEKMLGKGGFDLNCSISGEAFLTRDDKLTESLVGAVKEVTGLDPKLSTTGGTSDARFIKDVCPVIEFGTTGETAHHVDECVELEAISQLSEVYLQFLKAYLAE